MQIFGNILKDEEQLGGFEPNTPDDETFYLEKLNNYPENLPFFPKAEPEPISQETTSEPILESTQPPKADIIDINEAGSIWDAFEEIQQPQAQAPKEIAEIAIEEEIPATALPQEESTETTITPPIEIAPSDKIEPKEGEIEVIIPQPEELQEVDESILSDTRPKAEEINIDNLNLKNILEEEKDTATTQPQATAEESEIVGISEELKKLIEQDLERSKQRTKKIKEEASELITDSDKEKIKEFEPVENTGEYQVIDLSKLDFDRPSTTHIDKEAEQPPIIEQPQQTYLPPEEPPEQPSEEPPIAKEKQPKKLKKILIPVAFLLLALAGGTYYLYENELLFFASEEATNNIPIAPKDTIDTSKAISKPVAKIETKDTPKTFSQIKPETQKKEPEIKEKETQPKKEVPQKIIETPAPKKTTQDIAKQEEKPKVTTPKVEKTKRTIAQATTPPPKIIKTKQSIFTIEIYRTTSLEDAQQWLAKLKAMGIKEAHISSQKIRNILIYKVRYGNFNSLSEALESAKNSGFSQIWIDRVK